MIELVYVSHAIERFSADQISGLLSVARSNNAKKGITGLLLYDGMGTFMQALEGEEEHITALLDKIKKDSRHRRVNILWRGPITTRGFADWKMGFSKMSDLPTENLQGYSEFLQTDAKDEHLISHKGFASEMLAYFKSKHSDRGTI